jgi:hypothetical protein
MESCSAAQEIVVNGRNGPGVSGKLVRNGLMLRCIRGRLRAHCSKCCKLDERLLFF